ncbi:MAG: hypothetical protein C6Y22_13090 [Hapalosiphonaceae cyanobacterium JJU2]|nr:MAG: hypothetical protein C6Y22_13090 [Hapalosiphonaceae cyanobacterium JJU2]
MERRLSKIEKLLSNKNSASDSESVTITDSLNIPDIPKTKLSEAEILEIYNNNCQALANNAVKVAVTQESLINKDVLFLEKTKPKTASYWILATEDAQYWLLPKCNLRINAYNYETVNRLFQCDLYQPNYDNEFILIQLAKVSLTPSGEMWQLLEPGRLNFVFNISSTQEEISEKILDAEILEENSDSDYYSANQQDLKNHTSEHTVPNIENEPNPEILIVNIYNNKKYSLTQLAQTVLETKESIQQRSLNKNKIVFFEKSTAGEYWLFPIKQGVAYLVPTWNIEINQDNVSKLQDFFECRAYEPGSSNDFKLIKPAKFTPINSIVVEGINWVLKPKEKWKLEESGILEFAHISDVYSPVYI